MTRNCLVSAATCLLIHILTVQATVWGAELTAAGSTVTALHRVAARQQRFLERLSAALAGDLGRARQETAEAELRMERIVELEPPRRTEDLRTLRDWFLYYAEWLQQLEADNEDARQELMAGPLGTVAPLQDRCRSLAQGYADRSAQLVSLADMFRSELTRLELLLDRRRSLEGSRKSLEHHLDQLARRLDGADRSEKERRSVKDETDRLQGELRVVQRELLTLVDFREELRMHFLFLEEWSRLASIWFSLKAEEYGALQETAPLLVEPAMGSAALEKGFRRMTRLYEGQETRLLRIRENLERRDRLATPAGTHRDLDRAQDMRALYERYNANLRNDGLRASQQAGAYRTELAQLPGREGR